MFSDLLPKRLCFAVFIFLISLPVITFANVNVDNESGESPDRDLAGFEGLDEAQPLWEFGVGGGAGEVANYPASSERNFIALAAPYLVYRGDIFRLGGGGGIRAVVVEESDFEVDLSFGGAFSADSEDNSARDGMPELDFLFEVGPQFIYKVKDYSFDGGGNARLNARLQTRAVFSTDFGRLDQRGYVIEPTLSYQQRGVLFGKTVLTSRLAQAMQAKNCMTISIRSAQTLPPMPEMSLTLRAVIWAVKCLWDSLSRLPKTPADFLVEAHSFIKAPLMKTALYTRMMLPSVLPQVLFGDYMKVTLRRVGKLNK
jgi:hypothetical protein